MDIAKLCEFKIELEDNPDMLKWSSSVEIYIRFFVGNENKRRDLSPLCFKSRDPRPI